MPTNQTKYLPEVSWVISLSCRKRFGSSEVDPLSNCPLLCRKLCRKRKMAECSTCGDNGVVGGFICPAYGRKGGRGQRAKMQEVPDVISIICPRYRLNAI